MNANNAGYPDDMQLSEETCLWFDEIFFFVLKKNINWLLSAYNNDFDEYRSKLMILWIDFNDIGIIRNRVAISLILIVFVNDNIWKYSLEIVWLIFF